MSKITKGILGILLVLLLATPAFAAAAWGSFVSFSSNTTYTGNALGSNNGTYAILNGYSTNTTTLSIGFSSSHVGAGKVYMKNPTGSNVSVQVYAAVSNGSQFACGGQTTIFNIPANFNGVLTLPYCGNSWSFITMTLNGAQPPLWIDAVYAP